jgi:hypothetical protein
MICLLGIDRASIQGVRFMVWSKFLAGASLAVALASPSVSQAAFVYGELRFTSSGTPATFTGTNWASATGLTFQGLQNINSLLPTVTVPILGVVANVFNSTGVTVFNSASPLTSARLSVSAPLNLTGITALTPTLSPITNLFSFGSGRWAFDLVSLTRANIPIPILGTQTTLTGLGVLRDTTGAYQNTSAFFTLASPTVSGNTLTGYTVTLGASGVSAVPLPAGLPLIALGLAALGGLARRRAA